MEMCNFRNKMSFYRCLRIWWIAVGWLTKLLITYHNSDYNTCLPWFFLWIHLNWEFWNVIFSRCGSWGKVDMTKEKCVKGGGCSGENKSRKRIGDQSGSVHCCPTWSPSIDDDDDDDDGCWWRSSTEFCITKKVKTITMMGLSQQWTDFLAPFIEI